MANRDISKRTEKLEVRIPPEEKSAFLGAVRRERRTASEVLRGLIAQYVSAARQNITRVHPRRWRTRGLAAAAATGAVASVVLWPSAAAPYETAAAYDLRERDANGDGLLTYEEYAQQTQPAREQMSAESLEQFDAWERDYFEGIDLNKDGLVSLEEYQAYWDENSRRSFQQADLDGDGRLVLDELLAGRGKERGIASSMVLVSNFHEGIYEEDAPLVDDTDRNAPLSGQQAARLGQTFAIMDKNRDGVITLEEYMRPNQ